MASTSTAPAPARQVPAPVPGWEGLGAVPPGGPPAASGEIATLENEVKQLQALVQRLEDRLAGERVIIGSTVFPSYVDTEVWVKKFAPGNRYGFLVDGHTILEFLQASTHAGLEDVMDGQYKVERTKLASKFEATIIASFENRGPGFFYAGRDTAGKLGVTWKRWDPPGGAPGERFRLSSSLSQAKLALDNGINDKVGTMEGCRLAQDLLTAYVNFITEMSNWIEDTMRSLR